MDFLSDFNPADLKQYFEGADFPLDKEDAVKVAENNGAPGPVVDQLRNRLPEGEYSGPDQITNALGG